jgi:hypothetical protein
MAALVEGHSRNYDQVRLVRLMVNTVPARLKNSETTRTELFQPFNLAQYHLMSTDGRVEDPLAGFEGDLQYQPGIDLILGRSIERNAVRPGEFLQGKQHLLGQPTGPKPLVVTECPTLCQHLLAKRPLRHDLFSLSEGTCLAEHNKRLCPANEPERVIREGKGAGKALGATEMRYDDIPVCGERFLPFSEDIFCVFQISVKSSVSTSRPRD